MIELYTASTPNGQKIHIFLEEAGLEYTEHFVDIEKGEQFDPAFLKVSPNNKIPAILDHDGPDGDPVSVFESGCILLYLAEKTGKFLPTEPIIRLNVLEWVFWQMSGFGPMLGQAHHFRAYAPKKIDYAYDRYTNEARRLYQALGGNSLPVTAIQLLTWRFSRGVGCTAVRGKTSRNSPTWNAGLTLLRCAQRWPKIWINLKTRPIKKNGMMKVGLTYLVRGSTNQNRVLSNILFTNLISLPSGF